MPVPETTSAEALDRYVVGKKTAASKGPAWRDVQLSVFSLPPVAEVFTMPAVTEPFIVWITSGEAEAQERENNGPWVTSRLKKGSLFLTAAGAPYDFRWRTLTPEPFEVVLVFLGLPLFNEALKDVFGANAEHARLRDVSGFEDPHLIPLLQELREEARRPSTSRLFSGRNNTGVPGPSRYGRICFRRQRRAARIRNNLDLAGHVMRECEETDAVPSR